MQAYIVNNPTEKSTMQRYIVDNPPGKMAIGPLIAIDPVVKTMKQCGFNAISLSNPYDRIYVHFFFAPLLVLRGLSSW